jgi:hypothetical protein
MLLLDLCVASRRSDLGCWPHHSAASCGLFIFSSLRSLAQAFLLLIPEVKKEAMKES